MKRNQTAHNYKNGIEDNEIPSLFFSAGFTNVKSACDMHPMMRKMMGEN